MKATIGTAVVVMALGIGLRAQTRVWQPSAGHAQIAIWPGTPPDAAPASGPETLGIDEKPVAGRPWSYISNVTRPTMTVYRPAGRNTGAAVVVFPGGGYSILAIDLEGTEVCDWLTSRGITCVLLKYRVPDSGPAWHDDCRCNITPVAPTALEDAQRAIGLVRLHAVEWHIDPHKVGVLGFSAGGHLAAQISTHLSRRAYALIDAADQRNCHPDSRSHRIRATSRPPTTRSRSIPTCAAHIGARKPPTFPPQNEDDPVDRVEKMLSYFAALEKADVPVEMHSCATGGRAFGLRRTASPSTAWPDFVGR